MKKLLFILFLLPALLHAQPGGVTRIRAGDGVTISPTGGTGVVTINSTGGGGTPGGSDTQLQYNNAGAFGGIAGATWDGSVLVVPNLTLNSLTATRVVYAGTGGVLSDAAAFTFDSGTGTLSSTIGFFTNSIELSHATANTLTASGGILSIESVVIPTVSSADTLTNKTLTSPTISNPAITGISTQTGTGGAGAAIDFPDSGDTTITSSGGGKYILNNAVKLAGTVYDSAGSYGTDGFSLLTNGSGVATWARASAQFPITFIADQVAWAVPASAAFFAGQARTRTVADLSRYTQARIVANVGSTAPVDGTIMFVRYYTSESTTFSDYLPMGAASADVSVTLTATSNKASAGSWINLVAGAKADNLYLTIGGSDGNGSTSVAFGIIRVDFR